MNEPRILKVSHGQCSECGKDKKGARVTLTLSGDSEFFCWEHYRLLLEAMKPGRVEIQRVVEIRSCDFCCHSCCCHRNRTYTRSSYGVSMSETQGISSGISESSTEGKSRTDSVSRSSTRTDTRGTSQGGSQSLSESS